MLKLGLGQKHDHKKTDFSVSRMLQLLCLLILTAVWSGLSHCWWMTSLPELALAGFPAYVLWYADKTQQLFS